MATDNIFVENLDGGTTQINNMSGSTIMKQDVAGKRESIDVSMLADGV